MNGLLLLFCLAVAIPAALKVVVPAVIAAAPALGITLP